MNLRSESVVELEPALDGRMFYYEFSPCGTYCAVRAFCDGTYVIETASGACKRLGDTLTHQKGGVAWCDGRLAVLDCDTDGDWEGRLEVYGHMGDGSWAREHVIGGFWEARDELSTIADGRVLVASGGAGVLMVCVRGEEVRCLGHIPTRNAKIREVDGRIYVNANRFDYELTAWDEALDEAFGQGESPSHLGLEREAWK